MSTDVTLSKSSEDSSDMETSVKEATRNSTSLNEGGPKGDVIDQVSQSTSQSGVSELNEEDGKGDQLVNHSQHDDNKLINLHQETITSVNINDEKQVSYEQNSDSDVQEDFELRYDDDDDDVNFNQEVSYSQDDIKMSIDNQETVESVDLNKEKEVGSKDDCDSDVAQVVDCSQDNSNVIHTNDIQQETVEYVDKEKEARYKDSSNSEVQEKVEDKFNDNKSDQVADRLQDDDMHSIDVHQETVQSEKLEKLARLNKTSNSNIQEEMKLKCNNDDKSNHVAGTNDVNKSIDVQVTVQSVQNKDMQTDNQMKEKNLEEMYVESKNNVKNKKEDSDEETLNETVKSEDAIINKVEKTDEMQTDDQMKEEELQEMDMDSQDNIEIKKEDSDEEILNDIVKFEDVNVNKGGKSDNKQADDRMEEEQLQEIVVDNKDNIKISDEKNINETAKSEDVIKNKNNTDDKDTVENSNDVIKEIDKIISVNDTSKENDLLEDEDDGENTDMLNEGNKHRINKPDVMIEIPSQELIYFDDDLEEDLSNTDNSDLTNDQTDADTSATNANKTDGDPKAVRNETKSKDLEENEVDVEKEQTDAPVNRKDNVIEEPEVFPSTSGLTKMAPDASDEVPEVTDSLGLLAESSRVMEDEEEQDDDDDGDDEDDFDQDDESNQMTAEHSEDSNAHQSETDAPKAEMEIDEREVQEFAEEKAMVSDMKGDFEFTISNVVSEKPDQDMEVNEAGDKEVNVPSALSDEETMKATKTLENFLSGISEETVKEDDQISVETVKLSDGSDNEMETEAGQIKGDQDVNVEKKEENDQQMEHSPTKEAEKPSPSKMKKLEIAQPTHVVNIVDLEESSSEDDIQEVEKPMESEPEPELPAPGPVVQVTDVTSVNIPSEIEIMCTSAGNTSEIVTREKEVVISGVPKPKVAHKPARLNTSEVTIKTTTNASESTLVIPETKIDDTKDDKSKPKFSLEVFTLDSDDEETTGGTMKDTTPKKMTALEMDKARETNKCINYSCTSDATVCYVVADAATMAYYDAARKRKAMVCQTCADVVAKRTKGLVEGIKNLTPLLELDMEKQSQELVEISDSESDDEGEASESTKETIGAIGAKVLEEQLADMINSTWRKFNMDSRLRDAQKELNDEIEILEKESKEIDNMLNECQVATDKLRTELYATFEHERQELRAIEIYDTPEHKYSGTEDRVTTHEIRQSKRRLSNVSETPAKRPAIPLGYAPLDADSNAQTVQEPKSASGTTEVLKLDDDNVDISVVKLSAEAAPADLPPPGEISRPPIRHGMLVYGMRNSFRSWLRARIVEILPKTSQFTMCRVKFEHSTKSIYKTVPARYLAYNEPADVRMTIGTRVIALFKDAANSTTTATTTKESYYSGIIAEIPNPVNSYRYLVFFDDGYAQYVQHSHTRLVCECSSLVWEEVHPFSRQFVREYLLAYPERPMVRLHAGQSLKTEWNGKWWVSRVIQVDASLVQVHFEEDNRTEWIYRGSTRLAPLYLELQAAERHRARPMPRSTSNKGQARSNMPYVEYTRSDEQGNKSSDSHSQAQQNEEMRRQRAVAKKSTVTVTVSQQPPPPPAAVETVTSRVVYYTPKNAVKPYKMLPHTCGPKCKRSDVLALKDLRTYNPLAKPLLSGWERQIVRYHGRKEVMYRAPCGRRLRSVRELHRYLRAVGSDLPVDLFDYHPNTHCLAEFVLNKCLVSKKDLSDGKENVPVPCVNYYDNSLPEMCSYNTERTPTAGVPLNLDTEFLCGCDCTDDCEDKTKCACWKMTLEGARTIGLNGPDVGYFYKRLPEPLQSGIYECNSRCKCKATCLNRVAQHPLQLKLQVFKTMNRGWGIRALNDVPKGAFLCVYAGNLLTDATANLDGVNEGDEYLAELDYIEVVEQMKEGYEDDIPEADKILDKKEGAKQSAEDEEEEMSSSEDEASKHDKEDDDFKPAYDVVQEGVTEFKKNLRKRNRKNAEEAEGEKEKEKDKEKTKEKESNAEEDCITISDDEEVREPSRFMAQAGMGGKEFVPKHRSVRSYFGKDEACYIMDAKVQGNIGRYLNHSCCPNVFVQNVFVDTHDPRFPWVAFFALNHIRAGTELTWNYNYDVGSVPGKVLYCYCGAPNCRGRLL